MGNFISLFCLRIVDMSLFTVRFMLTMRGKRLLAWLFAFGGSLAYVIGVRSVLSNMSDWGKMLGYGFGYASGMLVGMWLEERIAVGYVQYRIVSLGRGPALIERLRAAGFAVTELPGRGRDGTVTLLQCSVPRRRAPDLERLALDEDPAAFITAQDVRPLQRGYWPQAE